MPAPISTSVDPVRAAQGEPDRENKTKISLVLFSGGSGTQSITETLLQHPQIALRILINAYDDGHSTGRLRRFIPGMLGPSDVRKNINRLMRVAERSEQSLQALSDYRLPVGIARDTGLRQIDAIIEGHAAQLPDKLKNALPKLACWQAAQLKSFLKT